ncbi:hypothetical protein, conserved, partial [Eimeria tenella]
MVLLQAVAGDLAAHIALGKERKEKQKELIQKLKREKELAECSFKPQTTKMPNFGKPSMSRRELLAQTQKKRKENEKEEINKFVKRELVEVDRHPATPPETPHFLEKEKREKKENEKKENQKNEINEKYNFNKNKHQQNTFQESPRQQVDSSKPPGGPPYTLWLMQEGAPPPKPFSFEEALRGAPLPPVPLDELSPAAEGGPPRAAKPSREGPLGAPRGDPRGAPRGPPEGPLGGPPGEALGGAPGGAPWGPL